MGDIQNAIDPNLAAATLAAGRARISYLVPDADRDIGRDPKKITFVEILMSEEQQALEAARAGSDLNYELLKHSLFAADDKPISWEADGKDRFLEATSAKFRQFLLVAYRDIHSPSAEAKAAFLLSKTIKVG